LAARTPEQALKTWVASLCQALQCVAQAEVFGTGHAIGQRNGILVVPHIPLAENTVLVRLTTQGPALRLRIFQDYTVVSGLDDPRHRSFRVQLLQYRYEVTDRDGNELFAYHLHPDSSSHFKGPHFHPSGVVPLALPPDSAGQGFFTLAIGKAHFPTGQITPQQVIRLLIEDLGVEPRTANWRQTLES
jgi:hypothetical protein